MNQTPVDYIRNTICHFWSVII